MLIAPFEGGGGGGGGDWLDGPFAGEPPEGGGGDDDDGGEGLPLGGVEDEPDTETSSFIPFEQ